MDKAFKQAFTPSSTVLKPLLSTTWNPAQAKKLQAGGFTGDAYKKAIRLVRKSGREHQIFNVDEMD